MSEEIIWGIDMNNSTTNYTPVKRCCRQTGDLCELATDFGFCKLTSCPNCGAKMEGEEE